jgi:hypothetical protein
MRFRTLIRSKDSRSKVLTEHNIPVIHFAFQRSKAESSHTDIVLDAYEEDSNICSLKFLYIAILG